MKRSLPVARAQQLVMAYGWNANCYQILNPGMDLWFPVSVPAVVGYTRRHNRLLVAGAPVCEPGVILKVCEEFEFFARQQNCQVCYVCAEGRLRSLYEGSSHHAIVTLGAQPVWDPGKWHQIVQNHASLRAQLNRCRNKAVSITALTPDQAAGNSELRGVLREWLNTRRLPPLHFLVEPTLLEGVVDDRVILTAARHGTVVAFLVASPVAARMGYLVELVARSPEAPNGASELLIDAAMRYFARNGRSYATLGLVALASAAESEIRNNPWWLRSLMQFARLHANRFYNFRGLEQFRVKMAPSRWDPVYAISTERRFSTRTLYSIGAAFSGIPPWLAVGIGAVKAVRQEWRGAFAHKTGRSRQKEMETANE